MCSRARGDCCSYIYVNLVVIIFPAGHNTRQKGTHVGHPGCRLTFGCLMLFSSWPPRSRARLAPEYRIEQNKGAPILLFAEPRLPAERRQREGRAGEGRRRGSGGHTRNELWLMLRQFANRGRSSSRTNGGGSMHCGNERRCYIQF